MSFITPPWPPSVPLQPSLYGLRLRMEHDPIVLELGGYFYGEAADGSGLTALQLDVLKAIAGGCPVDQDDPGVDL